MERCAPTPSMVISSLHRKLVPLLLLSHYPNPKNFLFSSLQRLPERCHRTTSTKNMYSVLTEEIFCERHFTFMVDVFFYALVRPFHVCCFSRNEPGCAPSVSGSGRGAVV